MDNVLNPGLHNGQNCLEPRRRASISGRVPEGYQRRAQEGGRGRLQGMASICLGASHPILRLHSYGYLCGGERELSPSPVVYSRRFHP